MLISKKELDQFCEKLVNLEEQKKAYADEIEDSISAFSVNQEITKKAVKKFYKEWKEAQKDKETYVLTDYEADRLFIVAFPDLAPTTESADGE